MESLELNKLEQGSFSQAVGLWEGIATNEK